MLPYKAKGGGPPARRPLFYERPVGRENWVEFSVQIHMPFKEDKVKASWWNLHPADWSTWEA